MVNKLFFCVLPFFACGKHTVLTTTVTPKVDSVTIVNAPIVVEDSTPIDSSSPALVISTPTFRCGTGADAIADWAPRLKGLRVACVVNASSLIGRTHLVDTLLGYEITIKRLFAPEHGFRGEADAGELVDDERDAKTGLPIVSLHGKTKKPSVEQLADVDVVIFDIQDVGVRFYTYISTLHYIMEACAAQNKRLIVLDRPNPHAHHVGGPVLEPAFTSFVGMHPVPIVYGMTIGEYAQMINGEGWLPNKSKCILEVIPLSYYDRYALSQEEFPVRPSPNLPNLLSIGLYPSICLFEGTALSVGRGTELQFQLFGCPNCVGDTTFTPLPNLGAKDPLYNGKLCKGYSLASKPLSAVLFGPTINLEYLSAQYNAYPNKSDFFLSNLFFDKLAGNATLRKQIISGANPATIYASWQPAIERFMEIREKYLIYP